MDENMQLPELRKLAKDRGIKNVTKLKKNELIELLKDTQEEKVENEEQPITVESEKDENKENKEDFVSGNRCIQSYK